MNSPTPHLHRPRCAMPPRYSAANAPQRTVHLIPDEAHHRVWSTKVPHPQCWFELHNINSTSALQEKERSEIAST